MSRGFVGAALLVLLLGGCSALQKYIPCRAFPSQVLPVKRFPPDQESTMPWRALAVITLPRTTFWAQMPTAGS